MSLIAKSVGTNVVPIEEGTHIAICSALIDLGVQPPFSDKFKATDKVMITFAVTDETYTNQDGKEIPKTISKEYTKSLNKKSNLYKDLNAWRGKQFTAEELEAFDLKNIIGVPCQISVTHTEKDGNKYANIGSVTGIPKGMKADTNIIDTIIFDLDEPSTYDNFINIPKWIQDKIISCIDFENLDFNTYYQKIDFTEMEDDELPF